VSQDGNLNSFGMSTDCENTWFLWWFQFSVSEESLASVKRVCFLRTFQWRHWAKLSNQSYTRSWQQIEGTGKQEVVILMLWGGNKTHD